ncbi:hypothetical protein O181_018207 [Austropuccinia psidii MF-1]|uniref:BAG domain-containing protein n=1 Tax=Austropuccinia psidii MF-1 TaxID=1389203 RepID=A0A9Q3C7E4_9BASI|nr:hypothetical protein [Austropuccinia psidii MF-1]
MEVTWDSEKLYVDLPVASLTLGGLKRYLASRTGVPAQHMKLFCNAGLMKDDSTPLSVYQAQIEGCFDRNDEKPGPFTRSGFWSSIISGLKKSQTPPMKIRMVGSKDTHAVVSDRPDLKVSSSMSNEDLTKESSPSIILDESSVILRIKNLTEQVLRDSTPKVENYERFVSTQIKPTASEDPRASPSSLVQTEPASNEFECLSEVLLQTLLQFDGFDVESGWTEARAARKEGVRAVQSLLDRLDQTKTLNNPTS